MIVCREAAGGVVVYAAVVERSGRVACWTCARERAQWLSAEEAAAVLRWYGARPEARLVRAE